MSDLPLLMVLQTNLAKDDSLTIEFGYYESYSKFPQIWGVAKSKHWGSAEFSGGCQPSHGDNGVRQTRIYRMKDKDGKTYTNGPDIYRQIRRAAATVARINAEKKAQARHRKWSETRIKKAARKARRDYEAKKEREQEERMQLELLEAYEGMLTREKQAELQSELISKLRDEFSASINSREKKRSLEYSVVGLDHPEIYDLDMWSFDELIMGACRLYMPPCPAIKELITLEES